MLRHGETEGGLGGRAHGGSSSSGRRSSTGGGVTSSGGSGAESLVFDIDLNAELKRCRRSKGALQAHLSALEAYERSLVSLIVRSQRSSEDDAEDGGSIGDSSRGGAPHHGGRDRTGDDDEDDDDDDDNDVFEPSRSGPANSASSQEGPGNGASASARPSAPVHSGSASGAARVPRPLARSAPPAAPVHGATQRRIAPGQKPASIPVDMMQWVFNNLSEASEAIMDYEAECGHQVSRDKNARGSKGNLAIFTCQTGRCDQANVEWRVETPNGHAAQVWIKSCKRRHTCAAGSGAASGGAGGGPASGASGAGEGAASGGEGGQ